MSQYPRADICDGHDFTLSPLTQQYPLKFNPALEGLRIIKKIHGILIQHDQLLPKELGVDCMLWNTHQPQTPG